MKFTCQDTHEHQGQLVMISFNIDKQQEEDWSGLAGVTPERFVPELRCQGGL